jgi:hypothetical protein
VSNAPESGLGGGSNSTAPLSIYLELSFTASGAVEDYDDALKDKLKDAFAVAAELDIDGKAPTGSSLSVTPASVLIVATFPVASSGIATSKSALLETKFTTPESLTTFLETQDITGVTAESAPTVAAISGSGGVGLNVGGGATAGGAGALIGYILFGVLLDAILFYICYKKYKRYMDARGANAKDDGKAAGAADGEGEGEDADGDGGGFDGNEVNDPVADYLDLGYTKGLDDSNTLAINPVMTWKMNGAKKRQRAAARAAQLGLSAEEAAAQGGDQGAAAAGSGRPGGLARLGFQLTKGKGNDKEVNYALEVKGIEMFLSREEGIDVKHAEARKGTTAGDRGAGILDIATSTEHRSNLGRAGGRRGSVIAETAAAAREQLKVLKESKADMFQSIAPGAGPSGGGASDAAYRESQIRKSRGAD